MDIVATAPVEIRKLDLLSEVTDPLNGRISRRAYDHFVNRGSVHGSDIEDWLRAERELTINVSGDIHCDAERVITEVILPRVEIGSLSVYVGLEQFVIASDPDQNGAQVLKVIHLPSNISQDAVEAERGQNVIRIVAAPSEFYPIERVSA